MSASAVRAAVEAAFRDFVVDGIATSGPHEPVKSEIRLALGQLLEQALSALGSGIQRYATIAARDADTAQDDGTLGYVWDNNGSPSDPLNGVYQWNGTAWEGADWFFSAVADVAQPFVDDAEAAALEAAAYAADAFASANSGAASNRARFPDNEHLALFLDKNRRSYANFNKAGRLDADLTEVRFPGWVMKERLRLDGAGRVAVLSANGRLLRYLDAGEASTDEIAAELAALAGSRATAADRVGQALDDYGNLRRYYFNEHLLRRTRYLRRKRLLAEAATISIALIGDSFTHLFSRYSGPLMDTLAAELGDAGGGWTGYGVGGGGTLPNGNARPSVYTYARTVGWDVSSYTAGPGPDLGQITASVAAEKVTRTGPDAAKLASFTLYWIGTSNGVVRYRWNGGAWTSINVQGTVGNLNSASLATNKPSSGAWTIEIETVSGTCTLCGDVAAGTDSGVVIHKLGSTGSRAQQWAAADATQWKAGIASLNPQLVSIMHGTNDQGSSRTPAQFKADLTTIVTRVREAMPLVDVIIAMPADNQRPDNVYAMPLYSAKAREVASELGCAFIDFQYLFGDDLADYASDGPNPLNNSDDVHPEPLTGGRVIVDGFHRLLTAL